MWDKLWEVIQKYGGLARDARIGAVGADQVRELYKSDKQEDKELAKELNDNYLAANAAGIAGGATAASALTAGIVPTLVSEVGGAIGSYAGGKAGSYLDEQFGTQWISPTLSVLGGLGGGIAGYKTLKPSYNYLAKNGVIGYKDIPEDFINLKYSDPVKWKQTFDPNREYWQQANKSAVRGATSYKFYEQPFTYFKTAKYPASSKSYNGKEIPTWQLPKGERNQPYNPTATERVFSVLGRDSKVKTKGVTDLELRMDSDVLHNYYALHNFLKTHGVNTSNITLNDLKALHNNRITAISELDNYNITSPLSMGMKHLSWFTRGYDKEGLVGSILTTGDASHNGAKIDMVRNLTTKSGTRPGFDPELIVNKSRTKIYNVSPRMYDAGIVVAKQTDNGRGIISGNMLAHPEITIKKWDMYPDKIVLGNYGQHDWNGELRSGPVVLLPTPRSNTIPTKSTLFYPSAIKNGKIIIERNHKSIFKKQGGKLKETK